MIIKLLYVILIFLVVRLVVRSLATINERKQVHKSKKQQDEDIIDAEYKVVKDD